ncbi:unnamed protein product [Linum trigynum]|uniref:Ubiquitinyl hydrolase 1 n=1 Tax=Linum trigynum TaxID=586398 RepID=A0AAV2E5B2_9ROSI
MVRLLRLCPLYQPWNKSRWITKPRKGIWYLPSDLQELATCYGLTPTKALELYDHTFLMRTENCDKVCLLMKDMQHCGKAHWYLAIIFIKEQEVLILDSSQSEE